MLVQQVCLCQAPPVLNIFFWFKAFHWTWGLLVLLYRMSNKHQDSSCLHASPPSTPALGSQYKAEAQLLTWVLKFQTQVHMLMWQVPDQLRSLASPNFMLLKPTLPSSTKLFLTIVFDKKTHKNQTKSWICL